MSDICQGCFGSKENGFCICRSQEFIIPAGAAGVCWLCDPPRDLTAEEVKDHMNEHRIAKIQ